MSRAVRPRAGDAAARESQRRGRPGYDKESLLNVAVKVFNERGYDGTSMEDLARTLGISKPAIYHHVRTKDELLRLALDRALDGLFAVAEEAAAVDGRAIDRLEHLVRGSVAVLVDRLPFVTLLLRVRGNTPVERAAQARRRGFDRLVTDLVEQAAVDGDVRPDVDPAITARLLFGLVNSTVEWYRPPGADGSGTALPGAAGSGAALPGAEGPGAALPGGLGADELADAVCAVAFGGLRQR